MSQTFVLERTQIIPTDIRTCWEFFSAPENLDTITPADLHFSIITDLKKRKMSDDMIIDYKVSPFKGLKILWRSKIVEVIEHVRFTDIQLKGPFNNWIHTHTFSETGNSIKMTDRVEYELPFDLPGSLIHLLFVKSRLEYIFDYRYSRIESIFRML